MDIRQIVLHLQADDNISAVQRATALNWRTVQHGSWERRMESCIRPDLLILDDFGLKPLSGQMPSDLYDVINERYEQGSIMVTSNRAPAEWPELFGDPLLASAGLDRLADQAETADDHRCELSPVPQPDGHTGG